MPIKKTREIKPPRAVINLRTKNSKKEDIENYTKKIFKKKPLVPISKVQASLLFSQAQAYTEATARSTRRIREKGKKEARRILNSAEEFKNHAGWISGGILEYSLSRIDITKAISEIRKKTKNQIRVLDIGSGTARMLAELKEKYRKEIETHSLDLSFEPQYPTDRKHFLMAEYMPEEFRNKFHLIVSKDALKYSIFPNIALKNICQALAPNGIAIINYSDFVSERMMSVKATDKEAFLEKRNNDFKRTVDDLKRDKRFEIEVKGEVIKIRKK